MIEIKCMIHDSIEGKQREDISYDLTDCLTSYLTEAWGLSTEDFTVIIGEDIPENKINLERWRFS